MLEDIRRFVADWLPCFDRDSRSYLTVAIGCTGGRHRSVYLAESLAAYFSAPRRLVRIELACSICISRARDLNVTEDHFIFPLGTVLFPGGTLPLKIFEQRYIEMTKACLRDNRPFGVCLIREGQEVGAPAVPETIGCLATIERWDMPQLGLFQLVARGGERFRLLETRVASNGLMSGLDRAHRARHARGASGSRVPGSAEARHRPRGRVQLSCADRARRRIVGRLPARRNPAARPARQTGAPRAA